MVSVDMLTTVHDPHDTRIYHKESRTLADAGYDVSILAHHPRDESANGIDIVSIGTADSRAERWKHLYRMYRTAAARDSDVYHFHDPELLPVGVWLSRTTDAGVVYDVHEDYENAIRHRDWIPDAVTPTLGRIVPAGQSVCAKRFDAVVTATEWIAEGFEERGHTNVTPVRNFPITEEITMGDPPEQPGWEHTLVYVGSVSETRGIYRMLELTSELRSRGLDVGLWVLGRFANVATAKRARSYIRDNDLNNAVRLFGRVEYVDIFSYLAFADIGLALVDADRYEYVIPTKVFEYMYAKLPTIATETLGPRKYLPDDAGLLVDETNIKKQVELIKGLLENPKKRGEMGQAGREHVEGEYSWKSESKKVLDVYSKVIR